MELTGGEIVLESLMRAGIPYVVVVPGPGNVPLLDALVGREDRIRAIVVTDAQAAVHLADGYFRASGAPLAVVTPGGPDAINAGAGLATSYTESTAVLCVTGAPHTHMVGTGVFQEIDRGRRGHALPDVLAPLVKRQWCIAQTAQLATVMQRAVTEMLTGRYGPVHIDLPVDMQAAAGEVELPDRIEAPQAWTTPPAGDLKAAAGLLHHAARPVILAGGGVERSGAAVALRALAECCGAAVATTRQGKSAFPNDHPLKVGIVGLDGAAPATEFCAQADVLLAVGCRFTDTTATPSQHGRGFNIPPTKLIHIDVDPQEIGKNYAPTIGLVGDARRTLDMLREALLAEGLPADYAQAPYTGEIAQARAQWEAQLAAARGDDLDRPTIPGILAETREFLDADAFLVSAGGATQAHILQEFPFAVAGTHVTSTAVAAPAFTVPAALGVKLARPDRQVLGVCDADAFLRSLSSLTTAVAYDIPVVFLVCTSSGPMLSHDLQTMGFRADGTGGTSPGAPARAPAGPAVAELAESMGCHGQQVGDTEEVQTALAAAFAYGGPAVIECVVTGDGAARPPAGPVPHAADARRSEC